MRFEATIIIPQFNHSELTCACLRSLSEHESCPVEVIVVDDGSSAECREQVESLNLADVKVIAQEHLGVSAAWNRGAAAATSPFLVFLNNDTVCRGPIVDRLLAPLKAGRALLAGAAMRRETALPRLVLDKLPTEQFLQGWCVALSRADYRRTGGFDESMAVYWSDTDFQARLLQGRQMPHEMITAIPDLPIRHSSHRTARHLPARRQIWRSDRETFIKKWTSV
jgi:GT2 family glycosyltransferase